MRLTLKVHSHCNEPPTDTQTRVFESFPIILGRSTACDYCLNDASRYISSNHAVIHRQDAQLLIQDSSANGVYINGATEPVGRGRKVVLNHRDSVTIGDFTLAVAIEHTAVSTSGNALDDPFDSFTSSETQQSLPESASAHDPFRGAEPDWTPQSANIHDPFMDDWETDAALRVDSAKSTVGNSEDDWANWPAADEPGASSLSSDSASLSSPNENDLDWLPGNSSETIPVADTTFDNPGREPRARQSQPQKRSPVRSTISNQRSQQTPANPGHAAAAARRPPVADEYRVQSSSNSSAESVEALLLAASLNLSDFKHRDGTDVLEQTGRLLAQMVDAIMMLLESRNELKNAIRSDVTTLSRKNNNPLKFSISSTDALTKLLSNDSEGYLQSDQAIQEAVDDLKLHQLAMLDGMKSAVKSLLVQFDPNKLAKTLEKKGGISANIPITREAKLWELFCEQHDAIREEAINNFSELFGAEFRKAYEKRIRKTGRPPDF